MIFGLPAHCSISESAGVLLQIILTAKIMLNNSRRVRVQYVRCPNEPAGDVPHWLLVDWDTRTDSTECCYHVPKVRVRFREPLKKGMVDYEESGRAWATVEPDPYDDTRYHRLNDPPLTTK